MIVLDAWPVAAFTALAVLFVGLVYWLWRCRREAGELRDRVELSAGDLECLQNLFSRFAPEETRRILLLAHWDTRPISDAALDVRVQSTPVPGANDGASGTAVLLQLAELMAANPPPVGVDILLVDGEDFGPTVDDMLLGARRYASTVQDADRPLYGVLLDMVGDADASFPVEGFSAQAANIVVQKVWRAAERLGYRSQFPSSVGRDLTDDHVPLTFRVSAGTTWVRVHPAGQ